jgi:hypothetical protein
MFFLVWMTIGRATAHPTGGLFGLRRPPAVVVVPLISLTAALAWRWHPEWLPATLILSLVSDPIFRLPDAYFANVDVFWTRAVGRSMYADFNYDMLTTPLILVALVAAIWWRWRSGRPSLEPDSSVTT